jgi:hypothetical protein
MAWRKLDIEFHCPNALNLIEALLHVRTFFMSGQEAIMAVTPSLFNGPELHSCSANFSRLLFHDVITTNRVPPSPTKISEQGQFISTNCSIQRLLTEAETNLIVFPNSSRMLAPTGAKFVQVKIDGEERASLTLMATIAARARSFPFRFFLHEISIAFMKLRLVLSMATQLITLATLVAFDKCNMQLGKYM